MADQKEEVVKTKVLFIFMRECSTADKKQGVVFHRVTKEEFDDGQFVDDDERYRVYSKKGLLLGQPGSVYEFDATDATGKSIYSTTKRYVGMWPDESKRIQWEGQNRTFINDRDARVLEKKESTNSLIKETLAPLRELYAKTPYPRKQALLALILYHITG
jgi:hypothetical protein